MKHNRTLLDSARQAPPPASLQRAMKLRAAPRAWARQLAFWGPVLLLAGLGLWLGAVLTRGTGSPLRWPLLALVAANLVYLAASGWPGMLGLIVRACSGREHTQENALQAASCQDSTNRTAVLLPIYNEDVRPVFAAVEAMAQAVSQAGMRRIDFFVLSDSTDAEIAVQEEAAFRGLQTRIPASVGVFYRRRVQNSGRKVGNIAEFCQHWGDEYDYMLVLDADSLMGPEAIGTLIGLMDANPRAGIIQTVPNPVGRDTLFARIQQFAARLYTPLLVEGLHFWQQAQANYWGHNAIIRIRPFVEHCELPVLPGREPFGGEILCHDVVEAALMQRAGWEVWVLPDALDSFESLPTNLVHYAQRERRWCQGNLQHVGVLARCGLGAMGRYHLGLGVAHYLAGPLALLFALVATLDAATGGNAARALLLGSGPAFLGLVLVLGTVLYGAKLAALCHVLADAEAARSYGGRLRLLASAALEQLAAFVGSPVLLMFYARFIVMLLAGLSVRWDAQQRDDRGVSWRETWRCMASVSLLSAAWAGLLAALGGGLLAWGAPLLLGPALAIPATVWSSRASVGCAARRLGLFLTGDETQPAPILRAFRRLMAKPSPALPALRPAAEPFTVESGPSPMAHAGAAGAAMSASKA